MPLCTSVPNSWQSMTNKAGIVVGVCVRSSPQHQNLSPQCQTSPGHLRDSKECGITVQASQFICILYANNIYALHSSFGTNQVVTWIKSVLPCSTCQNKIKEYQPLCGRHMLISICTDCMWVLKWCSNTFCLNCLSNGWKHSWNNHYHWL